MVSDKLRQIFIFLYFIKNKEPFFLKVFLVSEFNITLLNVTRDAV